MLQRHPPKDLNELRKPLYVFKKEDYLPVVLSLLIMFLIFIFTCVIIARIIK
jgi:hypothetical protein